MPPQRVPKPTGADNNTTRKRKLRKPSPELDKFVFPYFANQQLNPVDFPSSLRMPVGTPEWTPTPQELAASNSWFDMNKDDEDAFFDDEEYPRNDKAPISDPKVKNRASGNQNPYKRLKVPGGRPAMAKKVTADLDSDDEMIVRMKDANFKEKEIAQRLADDGRVKYNAKTIGTRYARIRRKLEEKNDADLDADLTDWHDGDDQELELAKKQADETIAKLTAELEMKRWKLVAENLKALKPVTNFSKNACKTRYLQLQDGTAKATPESIPDPDEHVLARIAGRKAREEKIEVDKKQFRLQAVLDPATEAMRKANFDGNGWTSKKISHK